MSLIKLICYEKSAANVGCRRCDERLILIDGKLFWGFAAQWSCRGGVQRDAEWILTEIIRYISH